MIAEFIILTLSWIHWRKPKIYCISLLYLQKSFCKRKFLSIFKLRILDSQRIFSHCYKEYWPFYVLFSFFRTAIKKMVFLPQLSIIDTIKKALWYNGYRLRLLHRRLQFDLHSRRFTWQVNEPLPGSTHALWGKFSSQFQALTGHL